MMLSDSFTTRPSLIKSKITLIVIKTWAIIGESPHTLYKTVGDPLWQEVE